MSRYRFRVPNFEVLPKTPLTDITGVTSARKALQVDIGFSDAVFPAPLAISYPLLLKDFPVPQLQADPKYTVVAEKPHAA